MNNIELIERLVSQTSALPLLDSGKLDALFRQSRMIIEKVFNHDSRYIKDIEGISFFSKVGYSYDKEAQRAADEKAWRSGQTQLLNLLNTMLEDLKLSSTTQEANFVGKNDIASLNTDFWRIIHYSIVKTSKKRFEDGQFADSVEAALKAVNTRVKDYTKSKTGEEHDGAELMNFTFSLNKPVIVLDDLSTQIGKDIQRGYMQIFAGSMTGIRNPKAHDNVTIDATRAIHFLFLASLLMSKLDEAKEP